MNDQSKTKPFLTSDPEYTMKVASVIAMKDPIENLKLEYLNNTLESFDIKDNPYNMVSLNNLNPDNLKILISKSFETINSSELNSEQYLCLLLVVINSLSQTKHFFFIPTNFCDNLYPFL